MNWQIANFSAPSDDEKAMTIGIIPKENEVESGIQHLSQTIDSTQLVAQECNDCGKCLGECAFLQHYGIPGQIAGQHMSGVADHYHTAFFCSLCHFCTELCPKGLPIAEMFLDIRRKAVAKGLGRFKEHRRLLGHQALGNSPLFTSYQLPVGCTTVFFPGCALPGTHPEQTLGLFTLLQEGIEGLGLVLDCCNKPSHDLGFHDRFLVNFSRKVVALQNLGVKKVLTACPSCLAIFRQYGKGLEVSTVYTHLADLIEKDRTMVYAADAIDCRYTLHDPCTLRFDSEISGAARRLIQSKGITITEMEHNRATTLCCGAGGAASCMAGGKNSGWRHKRLAEVGEAQMVTYCAGCTSAFASSKAIHLLDLLFPLSDKKGPSRKLPQAPLTYLNRLRLKWKTKKMVR
ncbi:MAG: (Fe-S)-binding protein [Pseudomonadota bacterium]